jgi:hypothetical protein
MKRISIFILCGISWFALLGCRKNDHSNEVRDELFAINLALDVFEEKSGLSLSQIESLSTKELYKMIVESNCLYYDNKRWETSKKFSDPWGHDYLWKIIQYTNRGSIHQRLRVYCVGPNGRFEEGRGDDDFYPTKP